MKILITQLGRIGDMILATPAFKWIKKKYPDSELVVLCSKLNHGIIQNNPNVDRVIVYDKKVKKAIKVYLQLMSERFDIHIDPKDHPSSESKIFLSFANAKKKFSIQSTLDLHLKDTHFYEIIKHQIEKCEISTFDQKPELFPDQDSIDYVKSKLNNENVSLINISASRKRKMWEAENWIEFIGKLNDTKRFILSYAPEEQGEALKILEAFPEKLIDLRSRSIDDVIAAVQLSDSIITPDTSIVHIAAAFNKPILTMFGGPEKEWVKWHPLSDLQVSIKTNGETLKNISSDELLEKWNELNQKLNKAS